MAKSNLTAERLRELLHYDPDTGVFTWISKISDKIVVGSTASSTRNDGYKIVRIDGHIYRQHRLAWLYMTSEWPENEIDHINCMRSDNRWNNLRDVSRKVNKQNRKTPQANNSLGILGVSKDKKKWLMQIKLEDGSNIRKAFNTPEEAHAAYLEAKRRLHPGCTI